MQSIQNLLLSITDDRWYILYAVVITFSAFLYLLFLALLTTVCLEILLILLIADFVLAILGGFIDN